MFPSSVKKIGRKKPNEKKAKKTNPIPCKKKAKKNQSVRLINKELGKKPGEKNPVKKNQAKNNYNSV